MKRRKPSSDPNVAAHSVLDEILRREELPHTRPVAAKNPAAVQLGRMGGLKGGPARAAKLSAERRREIAKKAVAAREAKRKKS